MSYNYKTEQESFWAGEFGDTYTLRNEGLQLKANNIHLFSTILKRVEKISSVLEFGANIGLNLQAIKELLPEIQVTAVEINKTATQVLRNFSYMNVYEQSILDFSASQKYDLVLSKGVLIHLNPEILPQVYQKMMEQTAKYICIAEYYNPSPIEINYRGHVNKLFKRDFAGEMLDLYKNLKLLDYGFVYHRDIFPQDDLTWFLLEKRD